MDWHDDTRERPVHYGCHEFGEDSELVIQGRAHPELERLYHEHLAWCRDCQRSHHRLETLYRRPKRVAPLDSFSRDREFDAILARTRGEHEPAGTSSAELRRMATWTSVGVLTTVAAVLALALVVPSFGAQLFAPPPVAALETTSEGVTSFDAHVQIPERRHGHQSQSFARLIGGGAVELHDSEGRPITTDSLSVGAQLQTFDEAVQFAFAGGLLANFEPRSIARWSVSSPRLVEFGLVRGTLAIRYDRRPGDPVLQVRTPSALVRVIGTVFTVAVDELGQTRVSVLRGRVEVLDPHSGRSLAAVEAGFRYDVSSASFRDVGRSEVSAALPLAELSAFDVTISTDGELVFEEPERVMSQIPQTWTVPGLSDDPSQRILDRVLAPEGEPMVSASDLVLFEDEGPNKKARVRSPSTNAGEAATLALIDSHVRRERERKQHVAARLEICRELQAEPETRFRAARCLGDFMREFGDQPEAVEGLLLLGTLRMDFAHDYQSATRNFEEFLRRAPRHPKAELARYKLVLAAIETGYIDHALARARAYLEHYPNGQYVGRLLQRFPELF